MIIVLLLISCVLGATCFSTQSSDAFSRQKELTAFVNKQVQISGIPALSVVIGNSHGVIYKESFGLAKKNSIYDLASITKVFTATAFLKELEGQNISVDSQYQDGVKFSNLLRHSSGFKAGLSNHDFKTTPAETFKHIKTMRPTRTSGLFHYSDINYLILGLELERLSGLKLNEYLTSNVLAPLEMDSTSFRPKNCERCLETVKDKKGVVHDPTSRFLGGVTGHAGVFSSLDDLAKFTSVFLNDGLYCGKEIISSRQVKMMKEKTASVRGLGFDITSPYSRLPRGDSFALNDSFGHTGYTGTSVWIDPTKDIFVIVLSNSVLKPKTKPKFLKLNNKISSFIGQSLL